MPNTRYPKQCYRMLRQIDESGRITWASKVKTLLFENGFGYAWIADEIGNQDFFLKLFKQRLKDIYLQKWNSNLNKSPKSYYYKEFKSMLETKTYLTTDMSYAYKRNLAQFRCSNHTLAIETGRRDKIDKQFRFCKYCLKNHTFSVEDEFHFLLICPLYDDIRKVCFPKIWYNRLPTKSLFLEPRPGGSVVSVSDS